MLVIVGATGAGKGLLTRLCDQSPDLKDRVHFASFPRDGMTVNDVSHVIVAERGPRQVNSIARRFRLTEADAAQRREQGTLDAHAWAVATGVPVLTHRYADLRDDPVATMRTVAAFVGVPEWPFTLDGMFDGDIAYDDRMYWTVNHDG